MQKIISHIIAGFCLSSVILFVAAASLAADQPAADEAATDLAATAVTEEEGEKAPEEKKEEEPKEEGEKAPEEKKEEEKAPEETPKEESEKAPEEKKESETPTAIPVVTITPVETPAAPPAAETPKIIAPPAATPPAAEKAPEKKYETFTLKSSPLVINTELDAVLWAPAFDTLTAKTKVWDALNVKFVLPHGHFVKKGERVLQFEREDYDRDLENARRGLEVSRLNFQKTKISYELAKKNRVLDDEDYALIRPQIDKEFQHTQKWDYDLVKRSYVDQMKAAEFTLENEKEELRQLEKMYRDNDMSEETEEIVLKRQRRVVEIAQMKLDQAMARNEWVMNETFPLFLRNHPRAYTRTLWQLEAETEARQVDRQLSEIAFQQAEVVLKQAEKRFREMEEDGNSLELTAPRDGYVYYGSFAEGAWENYLKVKPQMAEGESVQANKPILSIVDASQLELYGNVAEKDFSKVQTGQGGFFTPGAFPEAEFPVILTSISEMPVATGIYSATLSVDRTGDQPKVYPGMKGKVTLASVRKTNALLVPESAVGRNEALARCVYVLKDGTPQQRVVKIGRSADKKYEILDGLEAGMEVVKVYTSVEE